MKQNRRFHLRLLTLLLMAAGMLCFIISAPGCSRNNQSLAGVWISGREEITIPSTGRHARYFVEYEFKPDGTCRSTDYTIYDDGTAVRGARHTHSTMVHTGWKEAGFSILTRDQQNRNMTLQ